MEELKPRVVITLDPKQVCDAISRIEGCLDDLTAKAASAQDAVGGVGRLKVAAARAGVPVSGSERGPQSGSQGGAGAGVSGGAARLQELKADLDGSTKVLNDAGGTAVESLKALGELLTAGGELAEALSAASDEVSKGKAGGASLARVVSKAGKVLVNPLAGSLAVALELVLTSVVEILAEQLNGGIIDSTVLKQVTDVAKLNANSFEIEQIQKQVIPFIEQSDLSPTVKEGFVEEQRVRAKDLKEANGIIVGGLEGLPVSLQSKADELQRQFSDLDPLDGNALRALESLILEVRALEDAANRFLEIVPEGNTSDRLRKLREQDPVAQGLKIANEGEALALEREGFRPELNAFRAELGLSALSGGVAAPGAQDRLLAQEPSSAADLELSEEQLLANEKLKASLELLISSLEKARAEQEALTGALQETRPATSAAASEAEALGGQLDSAAAANDNLGVGLGESAEVVRFFFSENEKGLVGLKDTRAVMEELSEGYGVQGEKLEGATEDVKRHSEEVEKGAEAVAGKALPAVEGLCDGLEVEREKAAGATGELERHRAEVEKGAEAAAKEALPAAEGLCEGLEAEGEKAEGATDSLEKHREELEKGAEAAAAAAEEQRRQAEALERILIQPILNAIDGIQGAFSDAFKNILDGGVTSFEDFGDTVAEIMKVTASEIAAALVFEATFENLDPETILNGLGIPKDGSIFGADTEVTGVKGPPDDGLRGAQESGLSFGGIAAGGLAGAGIGAGVGSLTGLNTTGSTIGGAIGGAIGTAIAPGIGTLVGSILGSIAGGLIGGLFESDRNQTIQIGTVADGQQARRNADGSLFFEGGRFREGPFGVIGAINDNTSGTKRKLDDAVVDAVLGFDEALAEVLDLRQQAAVTQILQEAERGLKIKASSIGEGNISQIILDRTFTIVDGLFGRQLQGVRDALEQIPIKNVEEIATEAQRIVEIIALFADGFERGLRALTGGLNPLEQQVFELEEAAQDNATDILDTIKKIREAVDLLSPNVPKQEDFTKEVVTRVQKRVGEGEDARIVTEIIRETVPDVEAFRAAMEAARDAIKAHNKESRQAERQIRRMALAALGLGKDADVEPLEGAALALKEMKLSFKALRPVLEEVGITGREATDTIRKAIEKAKKELRKDFDESIEEQILKLKDPFKAALKELKETQRQRIQDAKRLGGDLKAVEELNRLERLELEKRFAQQSIDTVKGQIAQLKDFTTSLQTGPLTALSQAEQLGVARGNFNQVARKALRGDLDVGAFTSAAQLFLEEQRALSGSGAGFQAAFDRVLAVADQLGIDLNAELRAQEGNFKLRKDIKDEAEKDRKNRDENTDRVIGGIVDLGELTLEQMEELKKIGTGYRRPGFILFSQGRQRRCRVRRCRLGRCRVRPNC